VVAFLALTSDSGEPVGARCCAFQGEAGLDIAVGLRCGQVIIAQVLGGFGADCQLSERCRLGLTRKKEISEVKFSREGDRLAVASKENKIDIFVVDPASAYTHAATCVGHSSAVAHVDWDESGSWLQSVCTSYEPLFWDVSKDVIKDVSKVGSAPGGKAPELKPHTAVGDVAHVRWHTMTNPFAWSAIGVIGSSGTEVKAVDRDPSRAFLLAANDKHEVCIFSYPAVEGTSHASSGSAHCSKVTNVCVMSDGKRAVSVGGRDLSCMVWYITDDS